MSKKKSIYDKFATDQKAEKEGIVLDYGDGMEIRIARAGGSNTKFESLVQSKLRKYESLRKHDLLEIAVLRPIMREIYAEAVVLGWKGVTDKDGNDLPFNKENAIQLFTDLPDLFEDIVVQSQRAALFRQNVLEDEAGN